MPWFPQETQKIFCQSYSPSFQMLPLVPAAHTQRQAGSAEGQGQWSLWWPWLPVISKGSRSQFRALQELIWLMNVYSYKAAVSYSYKDRVSFSFFFFLFFYFKLYSSTQQACHGHEGNELRLLPAALLLLCHLCFPVTSNTLAKDKAHSLVQPLPVRPQLDQLSW